MIAGNTRLKAATRLGYAEVPVVWFDGSELDATAYQIADNKTHEFATWDNAALAKPTARKAKESAADVVGRILREAKVEEARRAKQTNGSGH